MDMWIVTVSLCSSVSLVVVLALCTCWKRKRQKDDLRGLDGMVTQKNPDENVNHLPSATIQCTPEIAITTVDESDYAAKRPSITNNTRRSLPDIPSESQARGDGIWDPNGDNSSELYATVEPYHHHLAKRHTLPNGLDSRPSVSQHSSISHADDAFSPYASVNYDKLKQLEHPYAIVKSPKDNDHNEILEEPTVRTALLTPDAAVPSTSSDPLPPPRSRRSSDESAGGGEINAATAVAGGIAASQELPYMTPPIGPSSQANFSGDSQDSSKGYTSITVREPLANIIAQTKEMNKAKRSLDPHYSTVSDDSDEMYTTIPDSNNQEYTSGSETYAQIQPVALTVAVEVNPVPSNLIANAVPETSEVAEPAPAPQPPSVDSLRHVTHSRQADPENFPASSSSSVLNLGSPKPEKRQANSPLPPPPSATTSPDFLLHVDKVKNLDDMYAKVHKNRRKGEDVERAPEIVASTSSQNDEVTVENEVKVVRREHNYETLKKSPRKNSDPGYETLKLKGECGEPGYASINGPDSLNVDPGYEVLNRRTASENDPNYEQLRDNTAGYSTIKESAMAGYSVINKQHKLNLKQLQMDEPNYESMPSEIDPNYCPSGSETDPNYESVRQNDPNYESVKYLDVSYKDDGSKGDGKNSGYETVDTSNSSGDPPYEKLNDDKTDSESSGYEKIEKTNDYETIKRQKECAVEEDEIFQV